MKQEQKWNPMFIRYGIWAFLLILIIIQLILPRWKDITTSQTSQPWQQGQQEAQQEKKIAVNFLKTQVPFTGQYTVYANTLADIHATISPEQKAQFQHYINSPVFTQIKNILQKEDIPTDFAYLPRILTKANLQYTEWKYIEERKIGIRALDRVVAKQYGARVDYFVDERQDVEKSTHAMTQYIKELYNLYEDWNMVMLSLLSSEHMRDIREQYVIASKYAGDREQYITDLGEKKINIMQAFKKPKTWNFYTDTSLVHTKFLDLLYWKLQAEYPQYGFEYQPLQLKKEKVVVDEEDWLNVMTIAKKYNLSYGVVKMLNPWIVGMLLPEGEREITLVDTLVK